MLAAAESLNVVIALLGDEDDDAVLAETTSAMTPADMRARHIECKHKHREVTSGFGAAASWFCHDCGQHFEGELPRGR